MRRNQGRLLINFTQIKDLNIYKTHPPRYYYQPRIIHISKMHYINKFISLRPSAIMLFNIRHENGNK